MKDSGAYYWAGGRKVALAADDRVAIDESSAEHAGVSREEVERLRRIGDDVTGDLFVVSSQELDAATREALDQSGALQPVYRSQDGTGVVVLPEVQVALGAGGRARLDALLRDGHIDAEVTGGRDDRVTLRPTSGRGADALLVANQVFEQAQPDIAQPHLVRMIDRLA